MSSIPFSRLSELFTPSEWAVVLTGRDHGIAVSAARSALIAKRIRVIALWFAVLTVAWIGVDALAFERALWLPLAFGRTVAGLAFAAIAVHEQKSHSPRATFYRLCALFAVPACFFAYSASVFARAPSADVHVLLTAAYVYLPFIVMTSLAIFPLTARENLALGASLLLVFVAAPAVFMAPYDSTQATGLLSASSSGFGTSGMAWPLMLVTGVAAISGMSQLQFLVAATEQSARDKLTGLFTRRFGEQILELQFEVAQRSGAALSAVFIDLDSFKSVNDRYGHDAGDKVLQAAARNLVAALRRQDIVVRWGGEEFLALMPNTDVEEALATMERIARAGLGMRPDAGAQTASLGLAERICDGANNWRQLIEIADGRMYAAKSAGRNRIVGGMGIERPFIALDQDRACERPSAGLRDEPLALTALNLPIEVATADRGF